MDYCTCTCRTRVERSSLHRDHLIMLTITCMLKKCVIGFNARLSRSSRPRSRARDLGSWTRQRFVLLDHHGLSQKKHLQNLVGLLKPLGPQGQFVWRLTPACIPWSSMLRKIPRHSICGGKTKVSDLLLTYIRGNLYRSAVCIQSTSCSRSL